MRCSNSLEESVVVGGEFLDFEGVYNGESRVCVISVVVVVMIISSKQLKPSGIRWEGVPKGDNICYNCHHFPISFSFYFNYCNII